MATIVTRAGKGSPLTFSEMDDNLTNLNNAKLELSGGNAGATVATATGSTTARTLANRFTDFVSVKDFGAVGDNSTVDTVAIQTAVAQVSSVNNKKLWVPGGKYVIDSVITVTKPITIVGDGQRSTIFRQTNGAANGFIFDFTADQLPSGGGMADLTIEAGAGWETSGFTGSGSTGTGLTVKYGGDGFLLSRVHVNGFDTGIVQNGCWHTRSFSCRVIFFRFLGWGVGVDPSIAASGGNSLLCVKISNLGYTGTKTDSDGLRIEKSGGEYWDTIDITDAATGVRINPSVGNFVLYLTVRAILADTSLFNNWYIDGSIGIVAASTFSDCWGAYSGGDSGPGGTAPIGRGGAGLALIGPLAAEIDFSNFRARENAYQGILLTGTPKNIKFIGGFATSNSQLEGGDNTYAGVEIQSGENIQFECFRSGNFTSVRPNDQAEGFSVASGVTGQISNCNVNDSGAGKLGISNLASGANLTGNLPRGTVSNNTGEAISVPVNSISNVTAGSTVYLTPNGQMTFAQQNSFICNKPGVVVGFNYFTTVAPGAGQSFVYTVFKNGVATAMTATSSGAASFSASTSANPFTVAQNDQIDVQLVTSAGAASSIHRGYFAISP
jgi:hypothetical protein